MGLCKYLFHTPISSLVSQLFHLGRTSLHDRFWVDICRCSDKEHTLIPCKVITNFQTDVVTSGRNDSQMKGRTVVAFI